jgi:hypothetical protein
VSDRVSAVIGTLASSAPTTGPLSARYFIVGKTGQGPTVPTIVRSIREYTGIFGARTGGSDMFDAAELALRGGVSEVVVCRATGPAAARATISLDTGKIVVTAKDVGAHANGWTAAWTSATSTLTIVAGSETETYVGATVEALLAAASASTRVTVTSSGSLPASNVTATALASGADDYASVDWDDVLAEIDPAYGPGAIATPGVTHAASGAALFAHAAASHRLALTTVAPGTAVAAAVSAAATVRAYANSNYGALVWPHVRVPAGAGLTKLVDPTAYAAAVRARALVSGPGESALNEEYARAVIDVEPEFPVSSASWASANTARLTVVRTVSGVTRIYSWQTLDAWQPTLLPAQYRDMVNDITWRAEQILERHSGGSGTPANFAAAAGELAGMVSAYTAYLAPRVIADVQVDPGYSVSVGGGVSPADNLITAQISLRFAESWEFTDLFVAVGDANAAI